MASEEEVARSQSFQGASAGAAAGNVTFRATAGAKPRQGNSRFLLVADRKIDARSQAQDSPRRTSGHAAQIRGSEHDHRRLKASLPPLHDHNLDSFRHRLWGRMPSCASALDKGHQSKNRRPMAEMGHTRRFRRRWPMAAIPRTADLDLDVAKTARSAP